MHKIELMRHIIAGVEADAEEEGEYTDQTVQFAVESYRQMTMPLVKELERDLFMATEGERVSVFVPGFTFRTFMALDYIWELESVWRTLNFKYGERELDLSWLPKLDDLPVTQFSRRPISRQPKAKRFKTACVECTKFGPKPWQLTEPSLPSCICKDVQLVPTSITTATQLHLLRRARN